MPFSKYSCSHSRILVLATTTLFLVSVLFLISDSRYLSTLAFVFNERVISRKMNVLLMIGGPHYTGTSILRMLMGEKENFSVMRNTGRAEDEGQHVQTVYARARRYGGPCRYASRSSSVAHMHMTEKNFDPTQLRIFEEWKPYWNLSKPVLVEKSPPNIIRSTWLQALADAKGVEMHFVFTMRHPFTIIQKNCPANWYEYTKGWFTMMEILESEIVKLKHAYIIRYEDWMSTESHVYEVLDRLETLMLSLRKNANTSLEQNSTRLLLSKRRKLGHSGKWKMERRMLKFRGNRGADHVQTRIKRVQWKRTDLIQEFKNKFETKLNRYGYSMNHTKVLSRLPENFKSRLIST